MKKLLVLVLCAGVLCIGLLSTYRNKAKGEDKHPDRDFSERSLSGSALSDSTDCNAHTYKLYPETVLLWNQTWSTVHEVEVGDGVRTISALDLKKLRDENRQANGLRIYYALPEEPGARPVPELILVNTYNCRDSFSPDAIPMVTAKETAYISLGNAKEYMKNWRVLRDTTSRTAVYAYNYSWEQIKGLVGDDLDKDLHIVYGLRTLSPQENQTDFEMAAKDESGDPEEIKYGSIIYVNVLYVGDLPDLENVRIRSSRQSEDQAQLDDFARPCPRYCDPESDLLDGLQP